MKRKVADRVKAHKAAREFKPENDRKLAQEAKDRAEGRGVCNMEINAPVRHILSTYKTGKSSEKRHRYIE
eukprot:1270966-Pleurochrysis_carterae.AAC.1